MEPVLAEFLHQNGCSDAIEKMNREKVTIHTIENVIIPTLSHLHE